MTVKEMEERSGLPRANIRYYEAEGLLHPTRSPNGYRDYLEEDLAALLKIKLLRELGCSLEDISALQKGTAVLSDVLAQRLETLEGETASLARARELCARLREDGATYDTLEPGRYAEEGAPPVVPWEPVPAAPPRYPWRRFFARSMDLLLAGTAVMLLLALVFNVSVQAWTGFGMRLVRTLLSLAVVVAVEPVLLHLWGTTPGKWVFRLRLSQENGAPLSYEDAFGRTLNVLLAGCGLLLPLASFVTYILSFYRDCKDIPQPWAVEGEVFEDAKPGKTFHILPRVLFSAAVFVLSVGALICGELKVARLPYPHPLTVSQFSANYNKIVRYQSRSQVSPLDLLTDDGAFQGNGVYDGVEYIGFDHFYQFSYYAPRGQLDAVDMNAPINVSAGEYYPGWELSRALLALEGEYALFWRADDDLARRCAALQGCDGEALSRLPHGGWTSFLHCAFSEEGVIQSVTCQFQRRYPQYTPD